MIDLADNDTCRYSHQLIDNNQESVGSYLALQILNFCYSRVNSKTINFHRNSEELIIKRT
jgi:hypothetical protein